MKAEDVDKLWRESTHWDPFERLKIFARACERHGVARAKRRAHFRLDKGRFDWSALDAEIAKENET